jgi:hypothetical protein
MEGCWVVSHMGKALFWVMERQQWRRFGVSDRNSGVEDDFLSRNSKEWHVRAED